MKASASAMRGHARHADVVQTGEHVQVLIAGELTVGRQGLRHVANRRAHRGCIADDIPSFDARAARARRQQRCQHLDQCALAGAVAAQQAKYLAFGHGQVEVVHDNVVPETAGQGHRLQGRFC